MVQEGELALTPEQPDSVASAEPANSNATVQPTYSVATAEPANSIATVLPTYSDTTVEPVDSVATAEPEYGLLLTPPPAAAPSSLRKETGNGVSFILMGLFLLFLIVGLRFHNNFKYIGAMLRNLIETRTRQNVFDDTVRETSLIVLLNLLWCCATGIVAYCVYSYFVPVEEMGNARAIGMLFGIGLAGVYCLFMWWAYAGVGWVFSDRNHSRIWVKGYSASQALMAPAMFLTALVGICRPDLGAAVGIVSAAVFITGKLAFIWKGYRIFFNQFSSWVLFLCYLCSLEIVPLILCYRCAIFLSSTQ